MRAAFLWLNGVLSVCVRADRDAPVLRCVSLLFALCVCVEGMWRETSLSSAHLSFTSLRLSISPVLCFCYIPAEFSLWLYLDGRSRTEGMGGFKSECQILSPEKEWRALRRAVKLKGLNTRCRRRLIKEDKCQAQRHHSEESPAHVHHFL